MLELWKNDPFCHIKHPYPSVCFRMMMKKREEMSGRGDLGEETVETKDRDMEKMIEAEEQEKGKEGGGQGQG